MLRSNWIEADIQFGAYGVSEAGQLFNADVLTRPFNARDLTLPGSHALGDFRLGQASRRSCCDQFSGETKFRCEGVVSGLVVGVTQKLFFPSLKVTLGRFPTSVQLVAPE